MKREIAYELKSKGFPQIWGVGSYGYLSDGVLWQYNPENTLGPASQDTYIPTLSQLIEACIPEKADDFGFSTHTNGWHAWYFYIGYFEHDLSFKDKDGLFHVDLNVYGETPDEAVAHLFLMLNKNAKSNG